MQADKLSNYYRGWLIGNFEPSLFKRENVEVAIKDYKKGEKEACHLHKKFTEYTIVIYGKIRMKEKIFLDGDIVKIDPGELTDFEAIEDCKTLVIRDGSDTNDKFFT